MNHVKSALLVGVGMAFVGCLGGQSGHQTSERAWLAACDKTADCGGDGLECLCGQCTVTCASDEPCEQRGGGSLCLATDDSALAVNCGGAALEGVAQLCAAPCSADRDCNGSLRCELGRCVAESSAAEPTGDGGGDAAVGGDAGAGGDGGGLPCLAAGCAGTPVLGEACPSEVKCAKAGAQWVRCECNPPDCTWVEATDAECSSLGSPDASDGSECTNDLECRVLNDCCSCEPIGKDEMTPPSCPDTCTVGVCSEQGTSSRAVRCNAGKCVLEYQCGERGSCGADEREAAGNCVPVEQCEMVDSCAECPADTYCQSISVASGVPGGAGFGYSSCAPVPKACGNSVTCDCAGDACMPGGICSPTQDGIACQFFAP